MRMVKSAVATISVFFISGCSILIPYDEKFACEGNAEYGKCTSVSGAYDESVTGNPSGPTIRNDNGDVYLDYKGLDKEEGESINVDLDFDDDTDFEDEFPMENEVRNKVAVKKTSKVLAKEIADIEYLKYKNSVYRELTGLIETPDKTPMVKQPTQVRTLVLSYSSEGKHTPLYMPRYVYYMLDDYMWVISGRVLNKNGSVSGIFGD